MMREELPEAVQSAIIALNSDTKTLTLKRYSDYEVISLNSILYVEKIKRQNSLRIVLTDRNVEHRETVQTLEKLLTGCGFFRINSGTLVNMKHIKQISGSNITMLNGKVLPVAASKLNTLKKEFSAYLRPDYSV